VALPAPGRSESGRMKLIRPGGRPRSKFDKAAVYLKGKPKGKPTLNLPVSLKARGATQAGTIMSCWFRSKFRCSNYLCIELDSEGAFKFAVDACRCHGMLAPSRQQDESR
jgi:hypothetical protein